MIDLLKNYKQLKNATGYLGSVRYFLAKKKLDILFIKWLKNNKQSVDALVSNAKHGTLKSVNEPLPLFPPRVQMNMTITPPRRDIGNCTPFTIIEPNRRTFMNETYNPYNPFSRSLQNHQPISIDTEKVPQFYFPEGKPIQTMTDKNTKSEIESAFEKQVYLSDQKLIELSRKIFGLPEYFGHLIKNKYAKSDKRGITKQQVLSYWKQNGAKGVHRKAFQLLVKENKKYLQPQDFNEILKIVMEVHPGLNFLKGSPVFQDLYSICVINRMFLMANRKNDYKMTQREFKCSRILKSFQDIELQSQINTNRDFFCYEDFYVIYIKFYELDAKHSSILDKQELSKYGGYSISRKTLQRIFQQSARKFQSSQGMTFGDFVWFIFFVQDKTCRQSIEYWFKILDLDSNGIVTGYQLEYFYEQQNQRLGDMENSSNEFNYQNMICQMVDLLKPKEGLQFKLQDFINKSKEVGVFINSLTDLNKMLAYDQRDPHQEKSFQTEHPDWTDWEKFSKAEYRRLENIDQNQQNEEVINLQNDE